MIRTCKHNGKRWHVFSAKGPNCGATNAWTFRLEQLGDDLYAWSEGGDASLETMESVKTRLRNMIGDEDELGGSALDGNGREV